MLAISIDLARQGQIALLRGDAPAPATPQAPAGMLLGTPGAAPQAPQV